MYWIGSLTKDRLERTLSGNLSSHNVEDFRSESKFQCQQVRQQDFDEIAELGDFMQSSEKFAILSVQGDSERHLVLFSLDAIVDHIIDNGLVLLMFLSLGLALAAFDVFFNALIDQDLGELILGSLDIELPCGLEGILQGFIIVVEVEV
jgi:hypothetical protein